MVVRVHQLNRGQIHPCILATFRERGIVDLAAILHHLDAGREGDPVTRRITRGLTREAGAARVVGDRGFLIGMSRSPAVGASEEV